MTDGQEQVSQETEAPQSREERKESLRAAAMAEFESGDSEETAEAEAPDEPQESVETKAPEAEKVDAAPDSALSRLMKKERDLLAREKQFKEQEGKYAELEKQATEVTQKLAELEKIKKFAAQDPVEFLKAAGVEGEALSKAARLLVAEDMGDSAPEDFKKLKEQSQFGREFASIKAELEQLKAERAQDAEQRQTREQEAQAERFREEYRSKLYSEVESAKFDYVRTMWDNNRDGAKSALFATAQRLAQSKLDAGIDEPPSNSEVYEALEKELSQYATWLSPRKSASVNTLNSNMDSAPPVSKEPDSESRDELRKRAYAEFFEAQKQEKS